jgi:hypothetical protein
VQESDTFLGVHLAQLNVARLRHPVDHPETAEFIRALEPINLLADISPGFVWRLQGPEGQDDATDVRLPGDDDPLLIVNLTVWEDVESLRHFAYRSGHAMYVRRKRDWFVPMDQEQTVLWWVPEGHLPTMDEASERLERLRAKGPTAAAFSLTQPFAPPEG